MTLSQDFMQTLRRESFEGRWNPYTYCSTFVDELVLEGPRPVLISQLHPWLDRIFAISTLGIETGKAEGWEYDFFAEKCAIFLGGDIMSFVSGKLPYADIPSVQRLRQSNPYCVQNVPIVRGYDPNDFPDDFDVPLYVHPLALQFIDALPPLALSTVDPTPVSSSTFCENACPVSETPAALMGCAPCDVLPSTPQCVASVGECSSVAPHPVEEKCCDDPFLVRQEKVMEQQTVEFSPVDAILAQVDAVVMSSTPLPLESRNVEARPCVVPLDAQGSSYLGRVVFKGATVALPDQRVPYFRDVRNQDTPPWVQLCGPPVRLPCEADVIRPEWRASEDVSVHAREVGSLTRQDENYLRLPSQLCRDLGDWGPVGCHRPVLHAYSMSTWDVMVSGETIVEGTIRRSLPVSYVPELFVDNRNHVMAVNAPQCALTNQMCLYPVRGPNGQLYDYMQLQYHRAVGHRPPFSSVGGEYQVTLDKGAMVILGLVGGRREGLHDTELLNDVDVQFIRDGLSPDYGVSIERDRHSAKRYVRVFDQDSHLNFVWVQVGSLDRLGCAIVASLRWWKLQEREEIHHTLSPPSVTDLFQDPFSVASRALASGGRLWRSWVDAWDERYRRLVGRDRGPKYGKIQ